MSSEAARDPYDAKLPPAWRAVDRVIIRTTEYLAAAIGASFTIMILAEITTRYLLDYSIFWVNSVAEFLLVWFFMIGAGLALRQNAHCGFEYVLDRVSKKWEAITLLGARLCTLFFCGMMAWSGYLTLEPASHQIEGATQISFLWVMLSLPIGFGLVIYHQIVILVGASERVPPSESLGL